MAHGLPAHAAPRTVRTRPQPIGMTLPRHQIRIIAHRARYQGQIAQMRRRCAFAVYVHALLLQHHIVRHIHHQAAVLCAKHLCKSRTQQFGNRNAIGPRITRRHPHGQQVIIGKRAAQGEQARFRVFLTRRPRRFGLVLPTLAHIKADIARACVHHCHHLTHFDACRVSPVAVHDFIYHLQFDKVIARAYCAQTGGAQNGAVCKKSLGRMLTAGLYLVSIENLRQFFQHAGFVRVLPQAKLGQRLYPRCQALVEQGTHGLRRDRQIAFVFEQQGF